MFDALIRTYNSATTIESVVIALRDQAIPPARIIVVDSSSRDDTVAIAKNYGCEVVHYDLEVFNYSKSLNLGIQHISAPACLVLSSHVILRDASITTRLLAEIRADDTPAAYVNYTRSDHYRASITADTFNGFNGLWNPCAMYRAETIRAIMFNESMPTAEDQFFAMELYKRRLRTVAIGSSGIEYNNPRSNGRKIRNEYVAIAYFVHPPLLRLRNIASIARSSLVSVLRCDTSAAFHYGALTTRLLAARAQRPVFTSRYFIEE